jgi:hypothetical protein
MKAIRAVIRLIVGIILGAFGGWLVGLTFHAGWWLLMGAAGKPFNIDSGLVLYTTPYAVIGAILGASMIAEE